MGRDPAVWLPLDARVLKKYTQDTLFYGWTVLFIKHNEGPESYQKAGGLKRTFMAFGMPLHRTRLHRDAGYMFAHQIFPLKPTI